MYKFTNGIVVFDEKTRDDYLKAGYRLMATGRIVQSNKLFDVPTLNEELNENSSNNGTIEEKPRRSKKVSK